MTDKEKQTLKLLTEIEALENARSDIAFFNYCDCYIKVKRTEHKISKNTMYRLISLLIDENRKKLEELRNESDNHIQK